MHNGLKPTIRGFKGVGWNRPLPSAFAFENSYMPDGVNDRFIIPGLIGQTLPADFTFEIWVKKNSALNQGFFVFYDGMVQLTFLVDDNTNLRLLQRRTTDAVGGNSLSSLSLYEGRTHLVATQRDGKITIYLNGQQNATGSYNPALHLGILTKAEFGYSWLYGASGDTFLKWPMDEARLYNKALSADEVRLNYNNGVGENPSTTEHIHLWYKFEKFEDLGSGLVNGFPVDIRDHSGKGFHLKGVNMINNPSDASFVLKANML